MTEDAADRPWDARPKYLHRFTDKRTGEERVYFRKDGARTPLKAAWGTQALADEVAAIVSRARPKPTPDTLVSAVRAYRGHKETGIAPSADYLTLSASTQKEYDRWLNRFEVTFEGVLFEDVNAAYILGLRDKWAAKGYRAANIALQIMKNICKPAMITGQIAGDPFALIENVRRPHALGESNPRWLDDEVEAFIAYALEKDQHGLARAVALGRWGGFRRQTICRVPLRARIQRRNDDGVMERRIYWVTEKKLVLCDRREDARLTALLDRTRNGPERGKVAPLTVAYNSRGESWKARALEHAVSRAVEKLAEAGKVRATLTIHGLRHARGVELALSGASDAGIMAQLDHATPRAAAIYRRQAERLQLADAAQDGVDDRVVKLSTRAAQKAGG